MPNYDTDVIRDHFQRSDAAQEVQVRGKLLEDLICYVLNQVPGVSISRRNVLNVFQTEEIDVAFWVEPDRDGFTFLPNIVLVECKNWSKPVGSTEVSYFAARLRDRGLQYGILVSAKGITGNAEDLNRAHFNMAMALRDGIRVLVVTRDELLALTSTDQLVTLLKEKLCDLAVCGTMAV